MFGYSNRTKIAFLKDGILYRPNKDCVERGYLTPKVTTQFKIVRKRDVK